MGSICCNSESPEAELADNITNIQTADILPNNDDQKTNGSKANEVQHGIDNLMNCVISWK